MLINPLSWSLWKYLQCLVTFHCLHAKKKCVWAASQWGLQYIQRQTAFFVAEQPFLPSSQSRKGRITHRKGEKSWLSKIKQEHLLITLMSFWPNLRAGIGWLEKLMRCLRSELHIFPKMLADLLFFTCSHPASMGCWVLFSSCSPLSWCTPRCCVPWTGLIVKTTFMCCL